MRLCELYINVFSKSTVDRSSNQFNAFYFIDNSPSINFYHYIFTLSLVGIFRETSSVFKVSL